MDARDRIQELIQNGEAADERAAWEVIFEEDFVEFLRTVNREQYLSEIEQVLQNPQTDPADQWDFNYRKAAVETGQTPDELEFLWYQVLLDIEATAVPQDEGAHRRHENTTRRLERKVGALASRIGEDHARGLFERYRQKLQWLFESY